MINAVSDLAKRTIQFEMCTIVCGAHYDPKWKEKDEEDEKKNKNDLNILEKKKLKSYMKKYLTIEKKNLFNKKHVSLRTEGSFFFSLFAHLIIIFHFCMEFNNFYLMQNSNITCL